MTASRYSQGLMNHDSTLEDFALQEVLRIEALLDNQVLTELQDIMEGRNYSWHTISRFLQAQLDKDALEFTLEHGDVIFEWNNLCDEKREWEQKGRLSVGIAEFNRDCLINLKIIPIKGGLGFEGNYVSGFILTCPNENLGSQLMTSNVDQPNLLTKDLGVHPDQWGLPTDCRTESLTDSSLAEEYEDEDYEDDDYKDDDYKDEECEESSDHEIYRYSGSPEESEYEA